MVREAPGRVRHIYGRVHSFSVRQFKAQHGKKTRQGMLLKVARIVFCILYRLLEL